MAMVQLELPRSSKSTFIPLSRSKDPISSYEAADMIAKSGTLDFQRNKVFRMLETYLKENREKPTSRELASYFQEDRHMVAKRLPDLANMGMVERSINRCRKCTISGVTAYEWWIE